MTVYLCVNEGAGTVQNVDSGAQLCLWNASQPFPVGDLGAYWFRVGDCYVPPTPSNTPSVTPSPTPSVTPSNTPAPTPGSSPSPTPSITPTPTVTPSVTPAACTTYTIDSYYDAGENEYVIDASWTYCNGSPGNLVQQSNVPFSSGNICAQNGTMSVITGTENIGGACS